MIVLSFRGAVIERGGGLVVRSAYPSVYVHANIEDAPLLPGYRSTVLQIS